MNSSSAEVKNESFYTSNSSIHFHDVYGEKLTSPLPLPFQMGRRALG